MHGNRTALLSIFVCGQRCPTYKMLGLDKHCIKFCSTQLSNVWSASRIRTDWIRRVALDRPDQKVGYSHATAVGHSVLSEVDDKRYHLC